MKATINYFDLLTTSISTFVIYPFAWVLFEIFIRMVRVSTLMISFRTTTESKSKLINRRMFILSIRKNSYIFRNFRPAFLPSNF